MATSPFDLFGPSPFARDPSLLLGGAGMLQPAAPAVPNFAGMEQLFTPTTPPKPAPSVLDRLTPGSDLHGKVIAKLKAMQSFSKRAMETHHSRWNYGELKVQAYADGINYKEFLANYEQDGMPPEPFKIIVPYSYATIHAAATFIATVLLGRKPIFPLRAVRGTNAEAGRYMEAAIQTQLNYSRAYERLWQHIWDSLVYGFSTLRTEWREVQGQTMRMVGGQREFVTDTIYSGNTLSTIDPYCVLPDPRVPLHECHERGEFFFSRMAIAKTVLKDLERLGQFKHLEAALSSAKGSREAAEVNSQRRIRIGEDQQTHASLSAPAGDVSGFYWATEGTVRLSPRDWGLGDRQESELWKFAVIGEQIVQAAPAGNIHAQHPYLCAEPTSFGYDFMSLSFGDMIGNFQDMISWIVSSRMENVRAAVSNTFVADPARVELNDIERGPIGRIIRMKSTALGLPIKEAIMQLGISDVTQGHFGDLQTMRILADTITGVNDNMRGIQTAGGRRSATEARMSMQAGASRLSQLAVRISAQSLHPAVSQMILNTQQLISDKFWIEQTGDDGQPLSTQVTPEQLVGSFNYQISDGSLPFDNMALVEQWKEILFGIARDPELRQRYDLGKIFEYTAKLGGATNIESFQRQQMPQPALEAGAMADPAAQLSNPFALGPAMPTAPIA